KQKVPTEVGKYVNAELTEDSTSRKEGVESWYDSANKENVTLTTEEESEEPDSAVGVDTHRVQQELA
ncbi:7964_t:CDS:2, partial [Gigaspora margarita]